MGLDPPPPVHMRPYEPDPLPPPCGRHKWMAPYGDGDKMKWSEKYDRPIHEEVRQTETDANRSGSSGGSEGSADPPGPIWGLKWPFSGQNVIFKSRPNNICDIN